MRSAKTIYVRTVLAPVLATVLAGSVLAARSSAQLPATTQPSSTDNSASDALDRMLNPANQTPAPLIPITFPPVPTKATAGALGQQITTQPTIREGTYMKDRSGVLTKSADGKQSIFTFDPDGSPIPEPPMVVLPNLKLQLMEQALSFNGPPPHFRGITGMLTSYRMNNYFLVTQVSGTDVLHAALSGMAGVGTLGAGTLGAGTATSQATTTTASDGSSSAPPMVATPPSPSASPDPSASETLDRMLKPASEAPMPLLTLASPPPTNQATVTAVAPGAASHAIVHEGTPVIDRTGRLSKGADGQETFSFDADGRAMQDPPLLILPNMKLEMLEQNKGGSNRDLRFRVTGTITEYRNRNYLLLDKIVVIPDVVQQF